MDDTGDNTPDSEIGFFSDLKGWVVRVFSNQPTGGMILYKPFDGQFSVDDGDDDFTTGCFNGSVDDEDIAVVDSCIGH